MVVFLIDSIESMSGSCARTTSGGVAWIGDGFAKKATIFLEVALAKSSW